MAVVTSNRTNQQPLRSLGHPEDTDGEEYIYIMCPAERRVKSYMSYSNWRSSWRDTFRKGISETVLET